MDRVGADFEMCVNMVARAPGANVVPIHLPLARASCSRHHRPVREVEIVYDDESLGKKYVEGPVPAAPERQSQRMRHHCCESIVEQDDAILHNIWRSTS